MLKTVEKYPVFTILFLVLIMLLPNLNSLSVTIMEARNFITAREMIEDGNWLLTTMNGVARYEKPPLPTWITALSAFVFGIKNVFGYRLPAVIMLCMVGVFVHLLSKKIIDNKLHSFYNGLIAITSFYIIGIIIEAPWDIYAHGFMLIGIYYLFDAYSKGGFLTIMLASFFVGCSVLSKGPVSLYALLLPFLISYSLVYNMSRKNSYKTVLVLILGGLIGGWWFLYVRVMDPKPFLEIATRETSRWSSYNVKPFYYYWSFFTQSGLWTIPAFISLLFPYLKNKVNDKKAYRFSFYWTLIAVILLSVIPEKKPRYLMPVLIPLSINIGFYINYIIIHFKTIKSKGERIPIYFNFGLLSAIGTLFPVIGIILLKNDLSSISLIFILGAVLLFIIGLLMARFLYKEQLKKVFYLSILFLVVIMAAVIPAGNKMILKNKDFNDMSLLKVETINGNIKVYYLDNISPEMIWSFGDTILKIEKKNGQYNFPKEDTFGVLINNNDLIKQDLNFKVSKKTTYNLNTINKGSKKYKQRLVNHYYIFQKK
tara:strand:- start:225059 stop:226678 length:1620 start_codon:yes stop_codon:yes gene_type:complete